MVHHGALPSDIRQVSGIFTTRRSIVKNSAYFALRHGPPRHSYAAIVTRLAAVLDRERDMHVHHEHLGFITADAVRRPLREADEAMDDAFAAATSPPRIRSSWWFCKGDPFLPFPVSVGTEDRRHVVLVCRNFELDNTTAFHVRTKPSPPLLRSTVTAFG